MTGDVMLGAVMEFVTKHRFLGNHLGQWLLLFAILLLILVLVKLVSFFLLRRADRLGKTEGWKVLELLLRCVERPVGLVILSGGLYVAGQFMTLTPPHYAFWNKVCQTIAVLAGGWLLFRLVAVVEHYLAQWTSKTETLLDDQLVPLVRKALRVFVVIVALANSSKYRLNRSPTRTPLMWTPSATPAAWQASASTITRLAAMVRFRAVSMSHIGMPVAEMFAGSLSCATR